MSCIVLDIELADENVFQKLGVFLNVRMQGNSFRPPKKHEPTKQTFWCTRKLHGIVWNSGRLDYSELSNILPRVVKAVYVAKRTEKCKVLGNLLNKKPENLENHGCPKSQDLVDEEN